MLDGKASSYSIRRELGKRLTQNGNRYLLCLFAIVVSLRQILNDETKQMKRLLFPYPPRFSKTEVTHSAGNQLQRDVQQWLSPPDPSSNHDFVWKAHSSGTAEWFFESNVLSEWKEMGSLLWIYGKRMFPPAPEYTSDCIDDLPIM
jgi:hypothetical protein